LNNFEINILTPDSAHGLALDSVTGKGAHSDFCQHAAFNWLRKLIYQFVGPRATTQVNGKLEKILFAASSSRRHWRVISTDARWQMPSWREPPGPWDPRIRSGRKKAPPFFMRRPGRA
jgi:hypothetical protein